MFRLCKVNCDNERSIAQTLDIQSLPTVFAINKGQNYDGLSCIHIWYTMMLYSNVYLLLFVYMSDMYCIYARTY